MLLQVECPAVTPEIVLKASGHVERFTDLMVTDMQTGDCHRADHLLEHHLEALLEDDKKPLPPETQKACYVTHCNIRTTDLPATDPQRPAASVQPAESIACWSREMP